MSPFLVVVSVSVQAELTQMSPFLVVVSVSVQAELTQDVT